MAIPPLQLPSSQAFTPTLDFSPLAKIGEGLERAHKQQSLAELGRGLSDGTLDLKAAAGRAMSLGDLGTGVSLLKLGEEQAKRKASEAADAQFYGSMPNLASLGGAYTPQAPTPAPAQSVPTAAAPQPSARAPVQPSAKVWGDQEAIDAGLYDPSPGGPGQPVQVAQAGGTPAAAPVAQPPAPAPGASQLSPRGQWALRGMMNPALSEGCRESLR